MQKQRKPKGELDLLEYCPNGYCKDKLNIHETEVSVEYYCLGGCGFYKLDIKESPGKILQRKDFIYEKRDKKKKKTRY